MQQSKPSSEHLSIQHAKELIRIFSEVHDERREKSCLHKIETILFIGLCTSICGETDFIAMEVWGELNEKWLRKIIGLPNGIPSHDVFRNVFSALDPEHFVEAFMLWVDGVRERSDDEVVALDGKALRGTKGNPGEMLTIVGAFASAQGISLGQLQVEGKSNEITAVPKLLDMLDIEGCIITADAMACQKVIVSKCVENKANYVIALKGNQGNLLKEISTFIDGMIDGGEAPSYVSEDRKRGRYERRKCWAYGDDLENWVTDHGEWEGLRSVVALELEREENGNTSIERRYFITSLAPDAEKLAKVVRAHWGIENTLHWSLDVIFGEDACRARTENAACNLSTLRRLALNMLKTTGAGKYEKWTIPKKRMAANKDEAYLTRLLALPTRA